MKWSAMATPILSGNRRWSETTEAGMIRNATEILTNHFGERPQGWMGPWIAETAITPDLLKEAGYSYIMDWPADDQPFWMRTRSGPLLSVPYPIEINDSPTMLTRAQSAADFRQMIVDHFEAMVQLSDAQALVFGISLHTFVAGQPFRLIQLRQALQAILQHPGMEGVWITTPGSYCAIFGQSAKGSGPGQRLAWTNSETAARTSRRTGLGRKRPALFQSERQAGMKFFETVSPDCRSALARPAASTSFTECYVSLDLQWCGGHSADTTILRFMDVKLK